MTVEFNHDAVMKLFRSKQKKFLTMTGHQGANLAAINSRVDTGTSQLAKTFSFTGLETIIIEAPMEYDVYLERKYGIMAKTEDQLIPFMARYEEEVFGG